MLIQGWALEHFTYVDTHFCVMMHHQEKQINVRKNERFRFTVALPNATILGIYVILVNIIVAITNLNARTCKNV